MESRAFRATVECAAFWRKLGGVISAIYSLLFGKGQKWVNDNNVADEIIGGWRVTPRFHCYYGTPFSVYSSNCVTQPVRPGGAVLFAGLLDWSRWRMKL